MSEHSRFQGCRVRADIEHASLHDAGATHNASSMQLKAIRIPEIMDRSIAQ
jgi:hypothetical protein